MPYYTRSQKEKRWTKSTAHLTSMLQRFLEPAVKSSDPFFSLRARSLPSTTNAKKPRLAGPSAKASSQAVSEELRRAAGAPPTK